MPLTIPASRDINSNPESFSNKTGICSSNDGIDDEITDDGLKILEINPKYGASMDSFINDALVDYCHYGSPDRRNQGVV